MTNSSVRACLRCHEKKVRCTGYPDCRNCSQADISCEPYARPRKSDCARAVKEAQRRINWLESELSRVSGVECKTVPTGTPLEVAHGKDDRLLHGNTPETSQDAPNRSRTQGLDSITTNTSSSRNDDGAPEMGLLALNATGESRYLGPSSGAAFATSAIALVQSCSRQQPAGRQQHDGIRAARDLSDSVTDHQPISPDEIKLLLQSYKLWVHPVYALFELESLDDLIMKCSAAQPHNVVGSLGQETSIFYLVMALGATNRTNTVKQLRIDPRKLIPSENAPLPAELFTKASQHFQFNVEHLRPSVMFIKALLLICIYCFYHPVGSSQWQLAGMAMRTAVEIGLHYVPKLNQVSTRDIDERSRVFWTAYAIEITLSYNLGRPPSIGEEHITARLPADTSNAASCAIHHIKHRQIQSRIISQVYYGKMHDVTPPQRENIIAGLQSELDQWRDALQSACLQDKDTAYPYHYWHRLYHGTVFVLHRASPLCPQPSDDSLERCIRSAGGYIDDVTEVLRTSNVPLSWMLVQGVLFAGVTMLCTARVCHTRLAARVGLRFLLVDLPSWCRKCSVCLAIMNERWNEDLLAKLDSQFEMLADNTLGLISTELASKNDSNENRGRERMVAAEFLPNGQGTAAEGQTSAIFPDLDGMESIDYLGIDASTFLDTGISGNWERSELFREVFGTDGAQSFLDVFGHDTGIADQGQRMYMS